MFRTSNNIRMTRGLFYEIAFDKSNVLYTLKREDSSYHGKTYPSIWKAYLETMDPTEYEFANKYFEDYDHWLVISEVNQMKPEINKWRKELQAKIRSEAYKRISKEAHSGGRNTFQANKYLVDGGYLTEDTEVAPRGRPKKQTEEDMVNEAEEHKSVVEDLKRLGVLPGMALEAPQEPVQAD